MKFVVDIMLGKLAKWLRVMGYDTVYQPAYPRGALQGFMAEGRILLTRHHQRAQLPGESVLLYKNRVGEQLGELGEKIDLAPNRADLFSRCIRCNTLLRDAPEARALEAVPEYIFHNCPGRIRFCPTCHRHYWPGSHRMRMETQLREWGLPSTSSE